MRSSSFVVFDTETTGLYPGYDQIVEIAASRFNNGETLDSFQTLVNPEREIPPEITAIHNITNEMVADAPSGREATEKFLEFIGDDPLVAHNAPFDERFVSFNCHRNDISAPGNPIYDTLLLTRRLFPELRGYGLAFLTNVFGIPHETKHRGMPDVFGTRGVLMECIQRLEQMQITTRDQFDKWYGDPVRFSPDKYNLLVKLPEDYKPLKDCVERGDCLEVVYEDRGGTRTRRKIQPQGLYVAYGNLYITAYCYLREANRNFKLERIHAYQILEEKDDLDDH